MTKQRRILKCSELAGMYFPKCSTSRNAVRCLSRWIANCQELKIELIEAGYRPYKHQNLTPKQYFIITKYLGDPFDD